MSQDDYVYVAIKPCGHASAICVDSPEDRKDTAKFVSARIREGFSVERLTRAEGIAKLKGSCEHGKIDEQMKAGHQ